MDAAKLRTYLRYLRGRIDTLRSAVVVEEAGVASLQSELRLFRERVGEFTFLDAKARGFLASVDLRIPAVHLAGSREHFQQTWWMNIPWIRIFFLERRRAKDRAVIDDRLARLRDEIYELYCLVEVSVQDA